jgi:hypothetical protein
MMAKWSNDTVMDTALSALRENVKQIAVCEGQPAGYDSAVTQGAQMLALTAVSGASFAALADGDTNGRKMTVNQHSGLTVSATGGGNHIALLSSAAASTLWYVTTATSQSLTSGNSLTINSWDIEIADPS